MIFKFVLLFCALVAILSLLEVLLTHSVDAVEHFKKRANTPRHPFKKQLPEEEWLWKYREPTDDKNNEKK